MSSGLPALILASSTPTLRAPATLIRVWKHCRIAFKSVWMPEPLLASLSPRLFNLTVLLLAQDKMENPCSGGLSGASTRSQEYRISPRIPSVHFRHDPINVRICAFAFHSLLPHQHTIRILSKGRRRNVFSKKTNKYFCFLIEKEF